MILADSVECVIWGRHPLVGIVLACATSPVILIDLLFEGACGNRSRRRKRWMI